MISTGSSGLVAGFIAALTTHPADVIKTRVQVNQSAEPLTSAISLIYQVLEKVKAFRSFLCHLFIFHGFRENRSRIYIFYF